jgi:hypothetical protein
VWPLGINAKLLRLGWPPEIKCDAQKLILGDPRFYW